MPILLKISRRFLPRKGELLMKIVGVAACTVGIAHTYIAREKLMEAAKKRGHEIHMETQGVIGIEDELDPKDIAEADVVILAVDVNVKGKERFAGKKMIEVPTETVVMSPNKLIEKIEQLV
jgi:fructose PTS system EIIB component